MEWSESKMGIWLGEVKKESIHIRSQEIVGDLGVRDVDREVQELFLKEFCA